MPKPDEYAKRGDEYAARVVSGKESAGKYIRLACQRHIEDRQRENWEWVWNPKVGGRICRLAEKTFEAAHRPYIDIPSVAVDFPVSGEYDLKVYLVNSGSVPADMVLISASLVMPTDRSVTALIDTKTPIALFPNERYELVLRKTPNPLLGELHFHVAYTSISKKKYTTECSYQANGLKTLGKISGKIS